MFKLNFYEIDTLINESGSVWLNLLVTFLGTGLGFLGAFFLNRRSEKGLKKKEVAKTLHLHRTRLDYLAQLIDNSLEVLSKNVSRFEQLISDIKKAPTDLHMMSIFADNNLQRLQKMDTKDIFDAYHALIPESEESIKDYKNIYGTIDFLHLNMVNTLK